MRIWGDENISGRLVRILDIYDSENEYRQLTDEFERGTADEIWLPDIAERYPDSILLSGDQRIARDKAQRAILKDSGLSLVYWDKNFAHAQFHEQAWRLLKIWPSVLNEVVPAQQRGKPGVWGIPFRANKLIK